MRKIRTPRSRGLAALLLVTLAGTSVAMSWLHGEAPSTKGPIVQEHHDPGTCVRLHDHGICVQYQHARWLPPAPKSVFGAPQLLWVSAHSPEPHDLGRVGDPVALPRAPPLS